VSDPDLDLEIGGKREVRGPPEKTFLGPSHLS